MWRVRGAPAGRRWPPAHHRDSSEPSGSDARGRDRRRRDHRVDRRHRPREASHRARPGARGRGTRAADGVERRGRRGADGHGRAARVVRPLRAPRPRPDRARPHRRALHEPRRRPAQDLSGGKRDQGDGAGDRRRRPANPSLARAGARARGASRDASVHAAKPQAGRRIRAHARRGDQAGASTTVTREASMTDGKRHAFELRPGMRRGITSAVPLPMRLVSNEEFPPIPQTAAQRRVEHRILAEAARLAPRLGLSRRDFLSRSGGMAASLLAMNAVFGRFFDVLPVEAADPAAFQERSGPPFFIFDVQLHYVSAGYDPTNAEASRKGAVSKQALLGLRRRSRRLNPKLESDRGTLADLSWENMVKEVFLDSETSIGLISTPPGPYPQEAVVPPKEMTHIRDEINRVTQSRRMLAHGLITPPPGQRDLDFMELQAATLKVDAWKGYTGAPPKGFDRGWFVDDEKLAYPMLERARKLGVTRVCLHKGLPLGPGEDYNHPRDLIKAAKDFPDIDFLAYHAGLLGVGAAGPPGEVPWTSELCRMKKREPGLRNIYVELGSTFGQLVTTHPTACAHLLGQVVDAFGPDHVLWGTDSIWYGTPQWQIEAFRRFEIPQALIDRHNYAPLTRTVKEQIFGLNA